MTLTVWRTTDTSEPVRFAAAELAAYLRRMMNQDVEESAVAAGAWPPLELRVGSGEAPRPGEAPLAERLARLIAPVPAAFAVSPGVDAFVWETGAGGAAIVGTNPRSTLFGVYDLLEDLGCRFYSPDPDDELIPRLPDPVFEQPRERFEQATFAYRERHLLEWLDVEATRREIDHTAKRRMNGFAFHIEDFAPDPQTWHVVLDDLVPEISRRGLMPGLGEHGGYVLFLPPERYASDHPDWYALVDGRRVGGFRADGQRFQFCTEHPDAKARFLANLEAFLQRYPQIQILHLAPEDVGRWCECDRCRPIPVADRYMRIDNAIAELARRIRPDISVTHLVYANHVELPEHERPAASLKISFVPFGRDFSTPFSDPRANLHFAAHPWSLELIQSWARLCQATGAGLIEHTKGFRHRWITFRLSPLPHLVADMQWWRSIGAHGFNAPQEGEGWWVKHLNAYVFARLMWNLEEPLPELLDDYFERYWAGVSSEVRAVFSAVSEALPNLAYSSSQPAHLANRSPGVRIPAEARWATDADYLERAVEQLGGVARRIAAVREAARVEPAVARRLVKLGEAVESAISSLEVGAGIRRVLLSRGGPEAAPAAAAARAAHGRFAALQTPRRLREGTLWTGQWRRDEAFAEWERESAAQA